MARIRFRETTFDDVETVARNMRAADVEEVVATGSTPRESLYKGLELSDHCVTVIGEHEEILVVYGVAPGCVLTGQGRPWLLGTDAALKYKREFLQLPRQIIPRMLTLYPRLENYVHVKNRVSVRWLKLLGFKMDEPVQIPSGEMFMRFHMTREDYV